MGRKPRIEFNGALYHVIQRGNNKEYIFKNNTYKKYYSDLQFINCVQKFLNEIILLDKYKGFLNIQEIIEIFIDKSIELDCEQLQDIIETSLSSYYESESKVACIDIEKLKEYTDSILNKKSNNIKKVNLFTNKNQKVLNT